MVPRNIAPGNYTFNVKVDPKNDSPLVMGIELEVKKVRIPKKWRFRNIMSFS